MDQPLRSHHGTSPGNPHEGRWKWWYAAIADWMLDNPGGTMVDCAKSIGRSAQIVSSIARTDLFKAHLAIRRKEFQARRDAAVLEKIHGVANKSMDLMIEVLDKKRDQVPIRTLQSIAEGALDRLGYAPHPVGGTTINNTVVAANVRPPVTLSELEDARAAYRAIQEKNRGRVIDHEPAAKRPPDPVGFADAPLERLQELPYDPLALAPLADH